MFSWRFEQIHFTNVLAVDVLRRLIRFFTVCIVSLPILLRLLGCLPILLRLLGCLPILLRLLGCLPILLRLLGCLPILLRLLGCLPILLRLLGCLPILLRLLGCLPILLRLLGCLPILLRLCVYKKRLNGRKHCRPWSEAAFCGVWFGLHCLVKLFYPNI